MDATFTRHLHDTSARSSTARTAWPMPGGAGRLSGDRTRPTPARSWPSVTRQTQRLTRRATVLARYNSDGTFDTTFGQGGKVIGANSGSSGTVTGVAIQADGKAIVVGTTMQRYNTDGSLDTTFGSGGIVNTAYTSVAIQPDGRIDVAGAAALARYLASEPQIGSFTANPNPVAVRRQRDADGRRSITDGNPGTAITPGRLLLHRRHRHPAGARLRHADQRRRRLVADLLTVGLAAGSLHRLRPGDRQRRRLRRPVQP